MCGRFGRAGAGDSEEEDRRHDGIGVFSFATKSKGRSPGGTPRSVKAMERPETKNPKACISLGLIACRFGNAYQRERERSPKDFFSCGLASFTVRFRSMYA